MGEVGWNVPARSMTGVDESGNMLYTQGNSRAQGFGPGDFNSGVSVDLTTYSSFAGSDIVAVAQIPGMSEPVVLATLRTISWSSARDHRPLRVLGMANPVTYSKSIRLIAGTLIFTSFDRDIWYKLTGAASTAKSGWILADMLPAFDITITGINEYGNLTRKAIRGIRIVDEGGVAGVDEMFIETTHTFVATDITPWIPQTAVRQ